MFCSHQAAITTEVCLVLTRQLPCHTCLCCSVHLNLAAHSSTHGILHVAAQPSRCRLCCSPVDLAVLIRAAWSIVALIAPPLLNLFPDHVIAQPGCDHTPYRNYICHMSATCEISESMITSDYPRTTFCICTFCAVWSRNSQNGHRPYYRMVLLLSVHSWTF